MQLQWMINSLKAMHSCGCRIKEADYFLSSIFDWRINWMVFAISGIQRWIRLNNEYCECNDVTWYRFYVQRKMLSSPQTQKNVGLAPALKGGRLLESLFSFRGPFTTRSGGGVWKLLYPPSFLSLSCYWSFHGANDKKRCSCVPQKWTVTTCHIHSDENWICPVEWITAMTKHKSTRSSVLGTTKQKIFNFLTYLNQFIISNTT